MFTRFEGMIEWFMDKVLNVVLTAMSKTYGIATWNTDACQKYVKKLENVFCIHNRYSCSKRNKDTLLNYI